MRQQTIETPWGPSQSQHEHAPGIVFHSTAGHGGYHLSQERYSEFCSIPQFAKFPQWLEEDCHAVLVYLRWPELATDEQLKGAVSMARTAATWKSDKWKAIEAWLREPSQAEILSRVVEHTKSVADLWRRGSMWTSKTSGLWEVLFHRGGDTQTVLMQYPMQKYYTDEEIAAVRQEPAMNPA